MRGDNGSVIESPTYSSGVPEFHVILIVGDGVEVVGVSFDGFFIHLSSSLCSYHFVVVYKMMGGQCFQRFEPI
jgi:hypothetical protein